MIPSSLSPEIAMYVASCVTDHHAIQVLTRINTTVSQAIEKKDDFSDNDAIQLLYSIGNIADTNHDSKKTTETIYMIMHRIRHEMKSPTALLTEIEKQKKELEALQAEYLKKIKENQDAAMLENIQNKMAAIKRKLVYLGEINHLYDLTIDETAELYNENQYEYLKDSTVCSYLPLVVQGDAFEKIYLTRYFHGIRPGTKTTVTAESASDSKTAAPTPANTPVLTATQPADSKEPVNSAFINELNLILDSYIINKTTSTEADAKQKVEICNEFKRQINSPTLKNVHDWLNIVIALGKKADELQNAGKACSECTEVLYVVMHKLRGEIKQHALQAFAARVEKEKAELAKQKENLHTARKNNQSNNIVITYEKAIREKRCDLAHLGEYNPLLELPIKQIIKIYPNDSAPVLNTGWKAVDGIVNALSTFMVRGAMSVLSKKTILHFEYSAELKPYEINGSSQNTVHLPLVLQSFFPIIFAKKYPVKVKENPAVPPADSTNTALPSSGKSGGGVAADTKSIMEALPPSSSSATTTAAAVSVVSDRKTADTAKSPTAFENGAALRQKLFEAYAEFKKIPSEKRKNKYADWERTCKTDKQMIPSFLSKLAAASIDVQPYAALGLVK